MGHNQIVEHSKEPADELDELAERQGVGFPLGYEYLSEKFPRQIGMPEEPHLGLTVGSDGFGIDHMTGRQRLTIDVRSGKQLTITYDPCNSGHEQISWVVRDEKAVRKMLEDKGLLPRKSIRKRIRDWLKAKSDEFKSSTDRLKFLSATQKQMLTKLYPDGFGQEMEQNNVADCYFVAMLYACNQNPVMPYIVADTVHFTNSNVAAVEFIGRSQHEEAVAIDMRKDLNGQVVAHRSGQEERKFPLTGQPGDRVLERAFARQRRSQEEVSPYHAPERVQTRVKYTMVAGEWGLTTEPLKLLFGDLGKIIDVSGNSGHETFALAGTVEHLDQLILFARDPDGYILTAGTPPKHVTPYPKRVHRREDGHSEQYFMDRDHFFFQNHAYAVIEVNETEQTVTVVNPHNTAKLRKTISFQDFGKYFSMLHGVALDKNKINTKFNGNIFDQ